MKNLFFILLLNGLLFAFTSCEKNPTPEGLPDCVAADIDDYRRARVVICDTAFVKEYLFQGQTVYVGYAGDSCVDGGEKVQNENCDELCFLGGLSGNQECDGVNFYENATFVKLIWEQEPR